VQRLEIEGEGCFKHFLKETNQAIGPVLGIRDVAKSFLDLACRADTDFIPVKKSLLQVMEGAIGLLAGGALAQDCIQELLEYRSNFRFAGS